MITIYQIQLTDEQVALINEKGHNAVPANVVRMNNQFGEKAFKASDFQYYTKAYEVDTDSKDKAFELTNLWNDQSKVKVFGDNGYSTSVGDIMEVNGQYFMVENFGFMEVDVKPAKATKKQKEIASKFWPDLATEKKVVAVAKKAVKGTSKKAIVANIIAEIGMEDKKTLIQRIMETLGVSKANAGVYVYNFKKAQ